MKRLRRRVVDEMVIVEGTAECRCGSRGGVAKPIRGNPQRYELVCRCGASSVFFGPGVAEIAERTRAEAYVADAARIARGEPIDEATLPKKGDR